jgi:hypothetical protein
MSSARQFDELFGIFGVVVYGLRRLDWSLIR